MFRFRAGLAFHKDTETNVRSQPKQCSHTLWEERRMYCFQMMPSTKKGMKFSGKDTDGRKCMTNGLVMSLEAMASTVVPSPSPRMPLCLLRLTKSGNQDS